ncbi:MAG: hypothetical protein ACK56I_05285, partial [bacterium]
RRRRRVRWRRVRWWRGRRLGGVRRGRRRIERLQHAVDVAEEGAEAVAVDRRRIRRRGDLAAVAGEALHFLVFARAFVEQVVAIEHRRGLQVHVEVALVARARAP